MPIPTMRCKFEPDHGVFANPTKLRAHYNSEHVHEYRPSPRTRFRCKLCGKIVAVPTGHLHQLHEERIAEIPYGVPMTEFYFDRVEDGAESRIEEQVANLERYRPREQHHDSLHPWTVDDIVLPVVTQLASPSGSVPVAHLAAIFAWREATEHLLETISRR